MSEAVENQKQRKILKTEEKDNGIKMRGDHCFQSNERILYTAKKTFSMRVEKTYSIKQTKN